MSKQSRPWTRRQRRARRRFNEYGWQTRNLRRIVDRFGWLVSHYTRPEFWVAQAPSMNAIGIPAIDPRVFKGSAP